MVIRLFRTGWMDWEEYERRINFLDQFLFEQSVRRDNLKLTS